MLLLILACRTESVDVQDTYAEEPQESVCSFEGPGIESSAGCIEGFSFQGMSMFLGIPYAEPPVGDLRWKRPVPIASWESTIHSDTLSQPCVQYNLSGGVVGSEDCLTLNVFRPQENDESLPILFFTHGGSYVSGMGSSEVMEAPPELGKNAILVTHNYRLGPFGFLAHPELTAEDGRLYEGGGTSGNLGLFDTYTALKWVYDNAEALGGAKDKIMVFGESAGGTKASQIVCGSLHGTRKYCKYRLQPRCVD